MIGRRLSRAFLVGFVAITVVFMIAPTLMVVAMSFGGTRSLDFPPRGFSMQWYESFFTDTWLDPTLTSLQIALMASLVATVLGTMAALGIVRGRFPGRQLLTGLFYAPLIVPTVILAIGVYSVYSDLRLTGTHTGLVLAHAALAIPFVVATVSASLLTVDPDIERAAANLGANPFSVFRRVTLPLILPGVAAGALFAFATSLDEVVVAIFLTSPDVNTLPVQIWSTLRDFLDPTIAAISSMLFGITVLVLAASLAIRKKGESPL
jgi:putative spermidine/putrescine transport system permease protein